jgi:hypothetical protein
VQATINYISLIGQRVSTSRNHSQASGIKIHKVTEYNCRKFGTEISLLQFYSLEPRSHFYSSTIWNRDLTFSSKIWNRDLIFTVLQFGTEISLLLFYNLEPRSHFYSSTIWNRDLTFTVLQFGTEISLLQFYNLE